MFTARLLESLNNNYGNFCPIWQNGVSTLHKKMYFQNVISWRDKLEKIWKFAFDKFTSSNPNPIAYKWNYIYTYIHNWPLQPFSQKHGLASHTTHVVCVNFILEWRDLQFNVDSERQIIDGNCVYSQSFCQKFAERK